MSRALDQPFQMRPAALVDQPLDQIGALGTRADRCATDGGADQPLDLRRLRQPGGQHVLAGPSPSRQASTHTDCATSPCSPPPTGHRGRRGRSGRSPLQRRRSAPVPAWRRPVRMTRCELFLGSLDVAEQGQDSMPRTDTGTRSSAAQVRTPLARRRRRRSRRLSPASPRSPRRLRPPDCAGPPSSNGGVSRSHSGVTNTGSAARRRSLAAAGFGPLSSGRAGMTGFSSQTSPGAQARRGRENR